MQKIATRIFIYASVAFGIVGMALVLVTPSSGEDSDLKIVLVRLLFGTVVVILPSFALAIAGKYLDGKS